MGADRKFVTWRWAGGAPQEYVHLDVRVRWGDAARFDEADDITEAKGAKGPTFYVDHPNPPVRVESPNLADLVVLIHDALNAYFNITWEPILAVVFEHHSDAMLAPTDCIGEASLRVVVSTFERGVGKNGEWWYRRTPKPRHSTNAPQRTIPGEPVIYPDTPEVRRRITGLRADLVAAQGHLLADLLSISKGPA